MKEIIKKGIGITIIYTLVLLSVFFVTNRVSELEDNTDFRNNNTSIAIKLSR